jgi:hypothetical protein
MQAGGRGGDLEPVLRIRIRCLFLLLDPGWVKKTGTGSRIRIRDDQPGSYFRELRIQFFWVKMLKLFDSDPGSGMGKIRIRIRIRDKHPGSATLLGAK